MIIPLNFEIRREVPESYETCDIYNYVTGYKGNYIVIRAKSFIHNIIANLSQDNVNHTRESLKKAVDEAMRLNRRAGMFYLFMNGGAFELESKI